MMERTWVDLLISQMYRHASARPLGPPSSDGQAAVLELRVRGRPIRVLVAVYDGPDEPSYLPRWIDRLVSDYLGGWAELRRIGVTRIDLWIPHGLVDAFQSRAPESVRGISIALRDIQDLQLPMEDVETATRSVVEAIGEVDVGELGPPPAAEGAEVGAGVAPAGTAGRTRAGAELELESRGSRLEELIEELLTELRAGGRVERDAKMAELEEALRELSREVKELKSSRGGESRRIESLEKRVDELSRSIDMLLMLVKFLTSGATVSPPSWPTPPPARRPARLEGEPERPRPAEAPGAPEPRETETIKDIKPRPAPETRPAPGEGASLELLEEFARDNPWADVLSKKGVKGNEG
ncbi:MAG: hypothetical protein DRO01_01470 [Thermoproteota archaeon]|nr:MAG: hypothetical protein DRO01_01470 [Candidatus Korarchaeota archaeon]